MRPDNVEIIVLDDFRTLTIKAAEEFCEKAQEAISIRGRFTVALSGGSTPKELYALLASEDAPFRQRLQWSKIHLFWGDERCVPPSHADSNYRMVDECLLSKTPLSPENVHPILAGGGDANKTAENYEQVLRRFLRLPDDGFPKFDLVLLGMGSDGHTASLFPGSDALREEKRLVAGVKIEESGSDRITLTPPALNNARLIMFIVSGESKAQTIRNVLEGEYMPERFPAQVVRPTDGKVLWLLDKAAGKAISNF